MTTATRTLAPPALPRIEGSFRSHRPERWPAAPVVPPEITTVLVLTVAGEVDDAWLEELTRGSGGASIRRLSVADRPPDGAPSAATRGDLLVAGDVCMDLGRFEVSVGGREVALTHQEFLLLQAFLRQPGQLLSRARLLQDAWGQIDEGSRRTVDVHVRRLRVKLGPAASRLVTVRGFGYRFEG